MSKDTGGPAFPSTGYMVRPATPPEELKHVGMTLRDYFAAAALQAMIAGRVINGPKTEGTWLVDVSYAWADAMLAERAK